MIPKGMLDYIMWREKCGRNRARELYVFTPGIWNERYQKHIQKDKEIERLNNIINELEKVSYLGIKENENKNNEPQTYLTIAYKYIYNKIKELKELKEGK